jgi:hypothetical protein
MTTVDVTTAWIEQMAVVVPVAGNSGSFKGALGFSGGIRYTSEQFVTMTYVNGYANTLLTANSSAGATSLTVSDRTGFLPGQQFQIYDGTATELLKVSASFVPTTGAGAVTLDAACVNAHTAGISVSALPPAIKQAAIHVTSSILKGRGTSAIVMGQLTPSQMYDQNPSQVMDINAAKAILEPFRRIR